MLNLYLSESLFSEIEFDLNLTWDTERPSDIVYFGDICIIINEYCIMNYL